MNISGKSLAIQNYLGIDSTISVSQSLLLTGWAHEEKYGLQSANAHIQDLPRAKAGGASRLGPLIEPDPEPCCTSFKHEHPAARGQWVLEQALSHQFTYNLIEPCLQHYLRQRW